MFKNQRMIRFLTIKLALLVLSFNANGTTYSIFSISHDLPLKKTEEKRKKNYFIDMGHYQGLKENTVLNVFRKISLLNPYKIENRPSYKIQVGQLRIVHVEKNTSIAIQVPWTRNKDINLNITSLKIGDTVEVRIK